MPKLKSLLSGIRAWDAVILAAVLAAAIASGIYVYGGAAARLRVVIESPEGSWIYSLDETMEVDIPGTLGNTRIHIENGEVHFEDSPCPNKTCIAAPALKRKGDWNACLPNEVIVRIEGTEKKSGVDIISR